MSIDVLQQKIRKGKNPSALVLDPDPTLVPQGMEPESYYLELLEALVGLIPAVRVDPGAFFLEGQEENLSKLLHRARELGYYLLLDWTKLESPRQASRSAQRLLREEIWPCDGVVISLYGGTDCVKPWVKTWGKEKDLFVVVKTANKSGSELQDLQTGGRMVYTAGADLMSRLGDNALGRCGYSRLGLLAGAYHGQSLKILREHYPHLFLLVDGLDEPGCNGRNASYAFDRMGHGALVCGSRSILGAWQESELPPVEAAVEAAERMKRNLTRYTTIL